MKVAVVRLIPPSFCKPAPIYPFAEKTRIPREKYVCCVAGYREQRMTSIHQRATPRNYLTFAGFFTLASFQSPSAKLRTKIERFQADDPVQTKHTAYPMICRCIAGQTTFVLTKILNCAPQSIVFSRGCCNYTTFFVLRILLSALT